MLLREKVSGKSITGSERSNDGPTTDSGQYRSPLGQRDRDARVLHDGTNDESARNVCRGDAGTNRSSLASTIHRIAHANTDDLVSTIHHTANAV